MSLLARDGLKMYGSIKTSDVYSRSMSQITMIGQVVSKPLPMRNRTAGESYMEYNLCVNDHTSKFPITIHNIRVPDKVPSIGDIIPEYV